MSCISEELSYRLKLNNFLRCSCKKHDYESWECRWIKRDYLKCTDHFSENLFWKALKTKDYKFLAFLTKSELLLGDQILEIKDHYKLEYKCDDTPTHSSEIWDSDESQDYKILFNWYYRNRINIVFIDINTDLNNVDPKYIEFLKKYKFPFIEKLF